MDGTGSSAIAPAPKAAVLPTACHRSAGPLPRCRDMNDTSKPHHPGSAEETTEERERRMAQHMVGPEDEVRKVPERPGSQATPEVGPARASCSGDRHAKA
jgi:hypothetical protein